MSNEPMKPDGENKLTCQLGDLDIVVDFFERDGELRTDSLTIAHVFGKSHAHVLRRIQKVQCSQEFNESNFRLVDYKDSKGERRPLIVMTKLGMLFRQSLLRPGGL